MDDEAEEIPMEDVVNDLSNIGTGKREDKRNISVIKLDLQSHCSRWVQGERKGLGEFYDTVTESIERIKEGQSLHRLSRSACH